MERGPWLFRDWVVLLAPYDGLYDLDLVELEYMHVWLHVHKLPEGYRKKEVATKLIERVAGKVKVLEMTLQEPLEEISFVLGFCMMFGNHLLGFFQSFWLVNNHYLLLNMRRLECYAMHVVCLVIGTRNVVLGSMKKNI
jgi:hypothetical protein